MGALQTDTGLTQPQVIILAGQSNMKRFAPAGEQGFTETWTRLNPMSKVRFIQCAIGGTPIDVWANTYIEACASGVDAKVTAVFFYQGEAEAASGNDWGAAFSVFKSKVRGYWGNVPLLFARLDGEGCCQYAWNWQAIKDQQTNSQDAHSFMVNTDDLPTDGLHLYPDSEYKLGQRFATILNDKLRGDE